jgi:hypothetical protein
MKLKTFNRYSHPESAISCGTVAVSLITGEAPEKIQERLNNLRRKNGWSPWKRLCDRHWMYWSEALTLTNRFGRKRKVVNPRYNPPLVKLSNKFSRGTYLVMTTNHLQVVKDGLIYDAFYNGSCFPVKIKNHDANRRKVWAYKRLD